MGHRRRVLDTLLQEYPQPGFFKASGP
ncbi:protein of unknown function [Azospirillum baldaniorum]|uniref:Uncharacterized protein n=1 Tax=Azospirillum baldaniorum TaxID=1064539 RepID=A0A9P1JP66_9PROT|nr:protein of unknown function [Azospirillum baldaniorum]